MSSRETGPTAEIEQRISDEIRGIHEESYGKEVTAARTFFAGDIVVCVLDIRLLAHERTLLEAGKSSDHIRSIRKQFQETMSATFEAAVEHMTGRRVVGFVSDTHIDPPFAVEFFRLAPEAVGSDLERKEESAA